MSEPLSYWDYVKAAFRWRVRLPGLGAMPVNQMALAVFGVLGIANPGFLFLGAAVELAYLGVLSSSSRFQRLVQGVRLEERAHGFDERVQLAYARLEPHSQSRYRALVQQCREVLGIAAPATDKDVLQSLRAGNLNQLLWLFMRLLSSRELVQDTLARVDRRQLEQQIATLRQRIAPAERDSTLARSLQATLDIQEKRLANLDAAARNLAVVDAELERIEQQVRLLREESAVSGGPELLSSRLDAVSATLSETSRWMDQHADLFTDMATADLDAGGVPALPRMPEEPQDEARAGPPVPRPRTRERQR